MKALAPFRIGNAAIGQRQPDVYGEVIHAMFAGPASGGIAAVAA